jgi:molybdenum cofactor biosynthesis protein B
VPTIVAQFLDWIAVDAVDAIISTGGTGVTGRDVTPEALAAVVDIPGFGELFRWLSFQSIGTSTIQSRACAGGWPGNIHLLPAGTDRCSGKMVGRDFCETS